LKQNTDPLESIKFVGYLLSEHKLAA